VAAAGGGVNYDLAKPDVETAQEPFELEQLLVLFRELDPMRVLEVGVWHGGTLWHWLQGGRTVVGIDNAMAESDQWEEWALEAGSTLYLIQGDSHDPSVIVTAENCGPYQFAFIDAGHTYEEVKADWDAYGRMVEPGGLVAFHDIMPRADYGVDRLWAELKAGGHWLEISAGRPDYCGIGVLWML